MRGEKGSYVRNVITSTGSSPHARGKGPVSGSLIAKFRIIPACAGKRTVRNRYGCGKQDHPRMRGEKTAMGR